MLNIRRETPEDYPAVEALTRRAFYNLYVPGCMEHYLVHIMRDHQDFVPELGLVLELDGQVIGAILYTRARLVDEAGNEKAILTFGPVCVAPEHQRRGYGRRLMERSFQEAAAMGFDVIVVFGSPSNYVSRGFQSCKKHSIRTEDGRYPAAMMVKELKPGALDGRKWVYHSSPVMEIDEEAARRYDAGLDPMEKKRLPSQEEFYIMSHSFLE